MRAAIESQRLATFEAVIERGLATFVDVGNALLRIRDERLYRESQDTFENYCKERWGFTHRHANRLIEAADVTTQLGPIGPTTESQARELSGLDPDTAAEVMTRAAESGRVTATAIREARREVTEPSPDAQQLADDLAAHDAVFAAIAQNFDRQDDEPALTQAECEALADPRDLDEPEPMPSEDELVEALERRNPGVKADVARARLRAQYARSITGVTGLFVLGPEHIAAVITDTEMGVLEGYGRELTKWIGKVSAAKRRTGLTVVNGGRQ